MKKISLISLTTLVFCSLLWFSCQKSKNVISPKSQINQVENNQPLTPTTKAEIIGHAISDFMSTTINTSFADFNLIHNTLIDASLSDQQKQTTISSNPAGNLLLTKAANTHNILLSNNANTFLDTPGNSNAVSAIVSSDLGFPDPLEGRPYNDCKGGLLLNIAHCNDNFADCMADEGYPHNVVTFVWYLGSYLACQANYLSCRVDAAVAYNNCVNDPGQQINIDTWLQNTFADYWLFYGVSTGPGYNANYN